jgi:hypothetical protein
MGIHSKPAIQNHLKTVARHSGRLVRRKGDTLRRCEQRLERGKEQVIALGPWDGRCGVLNKPHTSGVNPLGLTSEPPGSWWAARGAGGDGQNNEVITDFGAELSAPGPQPSHSRSVCASAPFRDAIELGLSRRRNAMAIWRTWWTPADSAATTKPRFVRKLHPNHSPEGAR